MTQFNSIKEIPKALLSTIDSLGFTSMTPIQEKTIQPILDHADILAQSITGSGKTLAFGIPLIIKTDVETNVPQALIITPTRELADQVAVELRKIASSKHNLKILTLYGGVPLRAQADSLSKGSHILIGTPGRLQDHLSKGTLTLDTIKTMVLDEADKMLDMGFYDEIIKINAKLPNIKQTLLFSATFPKKVEMLANDLLKDPLTIKIDKLQECTKIDELVYESADKFHTLLALIGLYKPRSLLIFCNTKAKVLSLTQELSNLGHSVIDLHGNLDQRERNESVICFSNSSKRILVATDVASRGLDIKDIEFVINFDLPFDKETYTHRIGRTGRANTKGTALSIIAPQERAKSAYLLEQAQIVSLKEAPLDTEFTLHSSYDTLCINGGKKTKLRAGDILGTFCKEIGLDNQMIGKITITDTFTYVALHHSVIQKVYKALKYTKIKKKKYIAWILD